MSNTKTKEPQQPSVYDELQKNGKAVLEAPTREALAELIDNIPANVKYRVGCVGCKHDATAFTIQVEII